MSRKKPNPIKALIESEGYTIFDYRFVFEDIIEPVGEEAVFWDQSKYPPEATLPTIQKPLKPRKKVFILKKGDSIIGFVRDDKDRLDEWMIFSNDERLKGILIPIVSKKEVKVTRKKRK